MSPLARVRAFAGGVCPLRASDAPRRLELVAQYCPLPAPHATACSPWRVRDALCDYGFSYPAENTSLVAASESSKSGICSDSASIVERSTWIGCGKLIDYSCNSGRVSRDLPECRGRDLFSWSQSVWALYERVLLVGSHQPTSGHSHVSLHSSVAPIATEQNLAPNGAGTRRVTRSPRNFSGSVRSEDMATQSCRHGTRSKCHDATPAHRSQRGSLPTQLSFIVWDAIKKRPHSKIFGVLHHESFVRQFNNRFGNRGQPPSPIPQLPFDSTVPLGRLWTVWHEPNLIVACGPTPRGSIAGIAKTKCSVGGKDNQNWAFVMVKFPCSNDLLFDSA